MSKPPAAPMPIYLPVLLLPCPVATNRPSLVVRTLFASRPTGVAAIGTLRPPGISSDSKSTASRPDVSLQRQISMRPLRLGLLLSRAFGAPARARVGPHADRAGHSTPCPNRRLHWVPRRNI